MNTLNIVKGDQYVIPFPVYVSGQLATTDNVDGVRIKLGETMKYYPGGGLEYDSERGAWCFPINETLSRSWDEGKMLPCQVGVRLGGDEFHYTQTFFVDVCPNIITEAWGV